MSHAKAFLHWALEGAMGAPVDNQWEEVQALYGQPHRHYHTIDHIEEMVDFFWRHRRRIEDCGGSFNRLVVAAVYHDVVYDPTATDNEEQSIQVMKRHLGEIGDVFSSVGDPGTNSRLILMTKQHQPTSVEEWWLCDADLMRFAAAPDLNREYNDRIRREYAHLSNEVWARGRRKALEPFLLREPFFHTTAFDRDAAARARQNILAEIDHWLEVEAAPR